MENDQKELKVRSLRIDENTFDKFKSIATEEFGNQGQCLSALINLYETEKSKHIIVDRKLEIESFQMYINKLQELYLTSLSLNEDTEERIKSSYDKLLDSKDRVIQNLQDKFELAEKEYLEMKKSSKELKLEFEKKEALIMELQKSLDEKTKEYTASLEDKTLLNKNLEQNCIEKNERINNLNTEIKELKKEIALLREDIASLDSIKLEVDKLKLIVSDKDIALKLKEEELKKQREQLEFEKEKVLLSFEREKQLEISKILESKNELANEYISKIEISNQNHNDEINKIKLESQNLQQQILELRLENEKLKVNKNTQ